MGSGPILPTRNARTSIEPLALTPSGRRRRQKDRKRARSTMEGGGGGADDAAANDAAAAAGQQQQQQQQGSTPSGPTGQLLQQLHQQQRAPPHAAALPLLQGLLTVPVANGQLAGTPPLGGAAGPPLQQHGGLMPSPGGPLAAMAPAPAPAPSVAAGRGRRGGIGGSPGAVAGNEDDAAGARFRLSDLDSISNLVRNLLIFPRKPTANRSRGICSVPCEFFLLCSADLDIISDLRLSYL